MHELECVPDDELFDEVRFRGLETTLREYESEELISELSRRGYDSIEKHKFDTIVNLYYSYIDLNTNYWDNWYLDKLDQELKNVFKVVLDKYII